MNISFYIAKGNKFDVPLRLNVIQVHVYLN